jgi:hypothetical protein
MYAYAYWAGLSGLDLNGPAYLSLVDVLALWAWAGPGWAGPFDSSSNNNAYINVLEKQKPTLMHLIQSTCPTRKVLPCTVDFDEYLYYYYTV